MAKIKEAVIFFYWRLLRKSPVFRYWYKSFLTELLFDLELHRDIEQKEVEEKYKKKLNDFPWPYKRAARPR